VEHILAGQGLEIELVRGVVVGAHRFRVAVDHDAFHAHFAKGEGGMDAAIVEFDALADAVGPAAQDHHLFSRRHPGFALGFIGGIVIGCGGPKFRRTGVHQFVDRPDAHVFTSPLYHFFRDAGKMGDLVVGKPVGLGTG
jgi:hypothetical protein